jgi:hypothetical protein
MIRRRELKDHLEAELDKARLGCSNWPDVRNVADPEQPMAYLLGRPVCLAGLTRKSA